MALDAGSIQASALLDISQFQKGVAQLTVGVDQINKSLGSIKDVTPRLSTDKLTQDVTVGRASLRAFLGDLGGIPGLSAGASSSLLNVGSGAAGMAAAMGVAVGATAALAAAMKTSTDQAVALEFQLAAVKSIKLDLDTKAASASIRELAAATGQSTESLAKGLYNLFSSINVTQTQAVKLMEQFAQGAVAAQTDTSTFGTAVIGVLNAYKLSVADATHVSDVFFNTVRDGVVTGPQLAAGLGAITASAKNAGVSLEEMGALIVGVTKEGGDAAQNLNNLNNILVKLVTKETTQQFKDLGISVADASGKLKSPIEILTALKARLEGLTEAQKANALQELFPDLQARQGAQVLISQLDTVKAALVTNRTEVGSTKTAYETMAATNKAALDRLQQSVSALAVEFGNSLLPAMTAVVSLAGDLVLGFSAAGRAVDAFLANENTRKAAALLIETKAAADRAAATAAQTGGGAAAAAVSAGATLPIPRVPTEPTAAGQFVETGLGQISEKAIALLEAARKATDSLTEAERALVEQHRERIKAEDALANIARAFEQDEREATRAAQERAEAQQKAAAAAADAIALTATAQERLAAGLAAGIGVQADWNAELTKALDPTKNLSGVLSGDLVQGILKAKQATEDSAKVFEINDLAIAAEVIRLRDLAAKTTDVAAALALQKQAGDLAAAALEAQKRGTEGATAAAAALVKPLDTLTSSILPALTAAQAAHVAELEHTAGKYAVLAEAAHQAGVDIAQFGDLTQLTGQQLAEVKAQVDAAIKGFAGFLNEEDKSRFSSVLGTLTSATDSATAAQAKMLEATGKTDQALTLLLQHAGASPSALGALKQALVEGGAEAFKAREAIQALTTLARDASGTIRLKVDVDIAAAQKAIGTLQQDFRAANAQRAETQTLATASFARETATYNQQRTAITSAYQASVAKIAAARTEASDQLGRDLAAAGKAQSAAVQAANATALTAMRAHADALRDAQLSQQVAFANAQKAYQDGVQALQDQTEQAIATAAAAQVTALRSLSAAMTAFNQQQVQNAFNASVALQAAQQEQFGFTDLQSQQSAQRAAQIQAQGAAGLAQQQQATALAQAQHSVAQQQLDATKALTKALDAAAKDMQKLAETQRQAETAARIGAQNAIAQANRTAVISRVGEEAFFSQNQVVKRMAIINGQPFIVEENVALATPTANLADVLGGTEGAKVQAQAAGQAARNAAFAQSIAAQQELDRQLAEAERKRTTDLAALEEQRQIQVEEFQRAERDRREVQRKADEAFREQLHTLRVQEAILAELKALTGQGIGGQNFNFAKIVAVETQTDFIDAATARLRTRVQNGV